MGATAAWFEKKNSLGSKQRHSHKQLRVKAPEGRPYFLLRNTSCPQKPEQSLILRSRDCLSLLSNNGTVIKRNGRMSLAQSVGPE